MKKNTASQVVGAQMVTAADGTAFTGAVTAYVTGDGGTQAVGSVGSGACTHEGNGFHTYAPAQAETNYDHVAFTFIGTGAVPSSVQIYTTFPQTADAPTAGAIADAVWDEVLTGATHNVASSAGRRLRGLQDFGLYQDAAVWIDTANGTAGTVDFENGTVTNPVDSIADAKTIADSLGLKRFHIRAGSTITLATTFDAYEFVGIGWNLALGGQDISASYFYGAVVTGIGTATISNALDYPNFEVCGFGATTVPPCRIKECTFGATLTLGSAGTYLFTSCRSNVAGGGAPVIDMGAAVGATQLNVRAYSGGIDLRNCLTGDTVTIEYIAGQAIIAASCTGGDIYLRGVGSLTDNSAGATVNSDAFLNNTAVPDGVWDEVLDNSMTARQLIRLHSSALLGKAALTATTATFRDLADSKDRITATVDSSGNRTAVTLDGS